MPGKQSAGNPTGPSKPEPFSPRLRLSTKTAFIACREGHVYAIDIQDGSVLWQRDLEEDFIASPLCVGKTLFLLSMNRHALSLNSDTGETDWSYVLTGESWASPILYGKSIYFGTQSGRVYAFDLEKSPS